MKRHGLDLGRLYVVSGHEEILTVLTHPGAAVDPAAVGLPRAGSTALAEVVTRMLPMRDGVLPAHDADCPSPRPSHRP
ncbi:hypothetical protein ACFVUH_22530 [Kitasatospora sp. NPDC058032]|uniref:hypothetical protein n=1 Tax=Kitasatospora sp. NPDC058032 TaxID=3346307 RepID=UPI0036D9A256